MTESLTTFEVVNDAIGVLHGQEDPTLDSVELDAAAGDLLQVLADLHAETGIDLETLPEVRRFASLIVEGP